MWIWIFKLLLKYCKRWTPSLSTKQHMSATFGTKSAQICACLLLYWRWCIPECPIMILSNYPFGAVTPFKRLNNEKVSNFEYLVRSAVSRLL